MKRRAHHAASAGNEQRRRHGAPRFGWDQIPLAYRWTRRNPLGWANLRDPFAVKSAIPTSLLRRRSKRDLMAWTAHRDRPLFPQRVQVNVASFARGNELWVWITAWAHLPVAPAPFRPRARSPQAGDQPGHAGFRRTVAHRLTPGHRSRDLRQPTSSKRDRSRAFDERTELSPGCRLNAAERESIECSRREDDLVIVNTAHTNEQSARRASQYSGQRRGPAPGDGHRLRAQIDPAASRPCRVAAFTAIARSRAGELPFRCGEVRGLDICGAETAPHLVTGFAERPGLRRGAEWCDHRSLSHNPLRPWQSRSAPAGLAVDKIKARGRGFNELADRLHVTSTDRLPVSSRSGCWSSASCATCRTCRGSVVLTRLHRDG